jgi:hypothetical protein
VKYPGQHIADEVRAEILRRLAQGEPPARIAREAGVNVKTVYHYAGKLAELKTPTERPRYRVPYRRDAVSDAGPVRVTVIGDLHVAPGQDLSRLRWIARHVGETRPDHIVQIGDWASFDSVSTHDPVGSIKAKNRPTLREDIEALHESLEVFDRELGASSTPRIVTLGNHEHRVCRYEDLRAELEDSIWRETLQEFARYRWQTADFGRVVFIGGVGFVHVPLNGIGKPHSSPNIIGNNLPHDLIRGHSHKAMYATFPKIGEDVGFTLIDVGTSLPHGHVESYAKLAQTGWYWGIHDVTIRGGRIDDFARISMKTLEAKYG